MCGSPCTLEQLGEERAVGQVSGVRGDVRECVFEVQWEAWPARFPPDTWDQVMQGSERAQVYVYLFLSLNK